MTRLSEILNNSQAAGVYLLEEACSLEELAKLAKGKSFEFFHLEGKSIGNKEQFLKQVAVTLHFPDYFGHNWDAFADCLMDMSWHEASGYIMLYDDFHFFAEHSREEFEAALSIFKESAEFWRNNGKSLFVLLWGTQPAQPKLPGIKF